MIITMKKRQTTFLKFIFKKKLKMNDSDFAALAQILQYLKLYILKTFKKDEIPK